jgi:hypothetical protein
MTDSRMYRFDRRSTRNIRRASILSINLALAITLLVTGVHCLSKQLGSAMVGLIVTAVAIDAIVSLILPLNLTLCLALNLLRGD